MRPIKTKIFIVKCQAKKEDTTVDFDCMYVLAKKKVDAMAKTLHYWEEKHYKDLVIEGYDFSVTECNEVTSNINILV